MQSPGNEFGFEDACARLGMDPAAPSSELQGAFQRAMKAARGPGGHVPADSYREILEAYRTLRNHFGAEPPEARRFEDWPSHMELTPEEAIVGGMKVGRLPTGRPFETRLPPGLRHGDLIWVWGWLLQVRVDEGDALAVRGDDVWITVHRARRSLVAGARLAVDTPLGPFSFRLTPEAIEAGLVRAPGLGLPARKQHKPGDLYVRFVIEERALTAGEMFKKMTKAA